MICFKFSSSSTLNIINKSKINQSNLRIHPKTIECKKFSKRQKNFLRKRELGLDRSIVGRWGILPGLERKKSGWREEERWPFSRASVASCPAFRLTRRNLLRRVSASNPREPWAQGGGGGGGGGGLSVGTVLRPVDSVGESNGSAWPNLTSRAPRRRPPISRKPLPNLALLPFIRPFFSPSPLFSLHFRIRDNFDQCVYADPERRGIIGVKVCINVEALGRE